MHLFFNDPRVAYVTRHRRIVRHPLVALVAGGVGVAALGVAIGAAGWEPPQQGRPAPQPAHQGMGMVTPGPVQDVNLYGVPAAPQPVLDLGTPPRTLAAPAKPKAMGRAQVRQVEKAKAPRTAAPSPTAEPTTAEPTIEPPATDEPTQEPAQEPTQEPTATLEPTQEPTQEPTVWHPGRQHHNPGNNWWPWKEGEAQTPAP